jgi:hypothetical protein
MILGGNVASQAQFEFEIGLSEEEKSDLETMIHEFRKTRDPLNPSPDLGSIQKQIESMNKRLAYLTTMFLTLDRRIKPLYQIIRLTYEKSELLNQRINSIIESLRPGEPHK